MELAGFDDHHEMFEIDGSLRPMDITATLHRGLSEHDMTTPLSDQDLSSPYAYNGTAEGIAGPQSGEASQSYPGLAFALPPPLTPRDDRQAVVPSSLTPEKEDQASPESKRRPRISPTKWEQIRPAFAALYRDQYKTLAETRRILEEEHDFKAS